MKQILTILLLVCAIVVGLMMPGLWLGWQDRSLETAQTIALSEPVLEWDSSKGLSREGEITSEEIAWRLKLFETGPAVTVPVGTATTDDVIWAASRAVAFLNMICEAEPDIYSADAEYQLAWFEDGTTFPFWTAYVNFNGSWRCLMTIDGESGAILECFINPNGKDLAELFPESFERASNEPDTSFEELVSQRLCDALGFFMGRNDGGANPVIPGEYPSSVYVTFADDPDLSMTLFFSVDLVEGINLNYPAAYG